ncbi:MAG TPA: O-antigen ligase family protein [Candidatus Tumulicola sp.]|jgi:O-antigen ligase
MPAAFAAVYAVLPLFPSFIVLTPVAFPGVSLVPRWLAVAVLLLVIVIAVYAATTLMQNPKPGSQPLLIPIGAWMGAGLLSAALGLDPLRGVVFIFVALLGAIWHCSLLRFFSDPGVARAILWSYLVSGTVAACIAIVTVIARWPATLYATSHGRATGTFVLPGELAAYLIVLLPIAFAVTRIRVTSALRAMAWATLATGTIALWLSYSRAGWMGAAAAAAFVIITRRGAPRGAVPALAVIAGALAIVIAAFNSHHDPSEDYTRLAIWRAALQVIDRFPLTGVGPLDFPRIYPSVHVPDADATAFHAHNLYLTFFAELGIVGIAAFAWLIWSFAVELYRRIVRTGSANCRLALAAAAGLTGVAVQGLIDTMSIVIVGLLFPTLGLALAAAGSGDPVDRPDAV